jgi:hypothetical protein
VGRVEKEGNGGCARGLKMGQFTLRMGPARAEVHSFVQRATIPSKRVIFFTFSIYKRHIWDNIFYLLSYYALQNNTFSPLQVKNKPCDKDSGTCVYSWLNRRYGSNSTGL